MGGRDVPAVIRGDGQPNRPDDERPHHPIGIHEGGVLGLVVGLIGCLGCLIGCGVGYQTDMHMHPPSPPTPPTLPPIKMYLKRINTRDSPRNRLRGDTAQNHGAPELEDGGDDGGLWFLVVYTCVCIHVCVLGGGELS
jgi:hypothetical protein